jgi:hypothetical protein
VTVRRALLEVAVVAAVAGVIVIFVAVIRPGRWELAVDSYLLFVGALFLLALTRATHLLSAGAPSEVEQRLSPRRRGRRSELGEQLPELDRIEREIVMGSVAAFDFHRRVRPLVREVAEHRLRRRGVFLDEQPARARAILGEDLWELVRPDRPPPEDRHGPGLELDDLEAAVARLERL